MLDMGINVLLCVMLTGSAWIDIRRKQISLLWIILFAVLGGVVNVILHRNTLWSALGGICIGAFLIGISRITRGAIGLGDGCIVCVTGVYLGFYKNMQLLLGALVLAALWGMILLILRRAGRKTELPFVPFLCAAHVIVWAAGG